MLPESKRITRTVFGYPVSVEFVINVDGQTGDLAPLVEIEGDHYVVRVHADEVSSMIEMLQRASGQGKAQP